MKQQLNSSKGGGRVKKRHKAKGKKSETKDQKYKRLGEMVGAKHPPMQPIEKRRGGMRY